MEQVLNFLESVYPLTPELRSYLQSVLKYRETGRRQYLLKGGHVCNHIYFLVQGILRCFYIKDETEICSWFMKEGDVVVSVRSFFSQSESYEWIETLEDCAFFYISYEELDYGYKHFPELNYIGRVVLEKYYALSEERLYSMRMQSSQERFDYFMQHSSSLLMRVPAKDIASYLGMRQETISRLRTNHSW